MSYDIYLKNPETEETLTLPFVPPQGGTFSVGSRDAEFNITYNYGKILYSLFPDEGIRFLYGKTAEETTPALVNAIAKLGDDTDPDYWKATEGNVKIALRSLLEMAIALPHGVWDGD